MVGRNSLSLPNQLLRQGGIWDTLYNKQGDVTFKMTPVLTDPTSFWRQVPGST